METLTLLAVWTLATVVPQLIHLSLYFSVIHISVNTLVYSHTNFQQLFGTFTFYTLFTSFTMSEIPTAE